MKKIILIIVLFFGIVAYSDSKIQNPPKETKIIRKTVKEYFHGVLEKEEIITYSYENNLVSKIITTSKSGDTIAKVRIKYDEDGKLKLMNVEMFPTKHMIKATSVTEVYNYTDDLITSVASSQNEYSHLRLYYYNSFKQVEKVKIIQDDNIESEGNYEYFFNGNISKIKFLYVKSSNNYSNRYKSYDDKNNPFELIFPSAYLKIHNLSKNNVTSSREDAIHYTYEYEYNPNNYPIKITTKDSEGKKTITIIEYE